MYIRLIGIAAVLLGVALTAFHLGGNDARATLEKERAAWTQEKLDMTAKAIAATEKLIQEQAEERNVRAAALQQAKTDYEKTLKDLNNEKRAFVSSIPADGLRLDASVASCTSSSGTSGSADAQGTGSCRLSHKVSEDLVELMTDADEVATQLNLCKRELYTVIEKSGAKEP